MAGYSAILLLSFFLYFFVIIKPTGYLNANALFVYIQMIMALGTFPLLDPEVHVDRVYGLITVLTLMIYMTTSAIYALSRPRRTTVASPEEESGAPEAASGMRAFVSVPVPSVWAMICLSAVIVVVYFRAVGYSALFSGLQNSLSGGVNDVASQRLDSYSGSRYFFPGYVNQFKNILLPALCLVVFTYWRAERQRHAALTAGLALFALFGLLGTGQRGAFIQFITVVIVYLYLINGKRFPKGVVKILAAAGAFVIISTVALGRSSANLGAGAGVVARAKSAVPEFRDRLFQVQQSAGLGGFRYIYELPVQWGHEWLQGLNGILPGSAGTDLPNRIYASLYGTPRGTAPPSVWGSVYHNFGWFGVIFFPMLFAVVFGAITRKAESSSARTTMQLAGIAGISTSIGFWAAGGPESLLNTGLLAYAVLWWWGGRVGTTADSTSRGLPFAASDRGGPAGSSSTEGPIRVVRGGGNSIHRTGSPKRQQYVP